MSIMHFAGMMSAASAPGTHQMVAGTDGGGPPETGFRDGSFGSINPSDLLGFNIRSVSVGGTPTVGSLAVDGYAGTQTGLWTSCTFESSDPNWNGVVYLASAATFYAAGSWLFGVRPLYIPGEIYNMEWV